MRKIISGCIFMGILLLTAYCYSYKKTLHFRPCSVHQWRQCDCLSLTSSYFQDNRNFTNPAINQICSDGTPTETMSEFPIIYYTMAQCWKVFGKNELLFRAFVTLLTFIGLFFLFRTFEEVLEKSFYAIGLTLLLFTSPIWAYYGNNFLADIPGLSFALIGWFHFMKFYRNEKNKHLFWAMFFFLVGGLIKISSLISFTAIFGVFFLELIFNLKLGEGRKIFNNSKVQIIPFILVIIAIGAWYLFSIEYNKTHNQGIFLTGILPIWNLSAERIHIIWESFSKKLIFSFYSKWMLWFLFFCWITPFIFYKKANKFLLIVTALMTIGAVLFFILWYDVFDIHDYYMSNLLIFPAIIILNFSLFIKENYEKILNSKTVKIVFLFFLGLNIFYASAENHIKYYHPANKTIFSTVVPKKILDYWRWYHWNYDMHFKAYETIESYDRSIGIKEDDKVISIPDPSIDISLYLMNQKGFTDYSYDNLSGVPRINKFIQLGAKYLFINDTTLCNKAYLKPFIKNKIGEYKNIVIYDLRNLPNQK